MPVLHKYMYYTFSQFFALHLSLLVGGPVDNRVSLYLIFFFLLLFSFFTAVYLSFFLNFSFCTRMHGHFLFSYLSRVYSYHVLETQVCGEPWRLIYPFKKTDMVLAVETNSTIRTWCEMHWVEYIIFRPGYPYLDLKYCKSEL